VREELKMVMLRGAVVSCEKTLFSACRKGVGVHIANNHKSSGKSFLLQYMQCEKIIYIAPQEKILDKMGKLVYHYKHKRNDRKK
jgi:hypothetical protein